MSILEFTDAQLAGDEPIALELVFSSTEESSEEKLGDSNVIWKDILPEGQIATTPGLNGAVVPFEVVTDGESKIERDKVTVSMTDLIASFDDKAFTDVTIPDGHPKKGDSALNNTGYVRALRVVNKGAKKVMQAALGFTEPEAHGKVKRGTVPNVSAGIFLNFLRKHDRKRFRAALNHVALTKTPWMNISGFKKVFASDDVEVDEQGFEIVMATFAEDDNSDDGGGDKETGEIVWNKEDSTQFVREAIMQALNPPVDPEAPQPIDGRAYYDVMDISRSDTALVQEFYKGSSTKFVIPFKFTEGKVVLPPQLRWQEVEDALIAASDEPSDLDKVLDAIRVQMADSAEAGTKQPVPAPASTTVVPLHDESTPEGRVAAARQRRRAKFPELFANSH